MTKAHGPIRSYGRTGGRPLSARQQGLVDTLLPLLRVPESAPGTLNPLTLFGPVAEQVWLEIGFGGGEHTSGQAERHPGVGLIGCEVFVEGVAKCLSDIDRLGLTNLRLWDEDARALMAMLADHSVARCFILFPDPWPKTKHQKRRLIQPDFLNELHRIMKPRGGVRFATDVRSYADEALWKFIAHGGFDWQGECARDWREAPGDHVHTRYEAKNLGDIAPVFYEFSVRPR